MNTHPSTKKVMFKTIPRSGLFLLAKQRANGAMRDKRDRRSQEPQDYDLEDQISYSDLLNIKQMFIDTYNLNQVEAGIVSNGIYVLKVIVLDPTLEIPDEFQGITVYKETKEKERF